MTDAPALDLVHTLARSEGMSSRRERAHVFDVGTGGLVAVNAARAEDAGAPAARLPGAGA